MSIAIRSTSPRRRAGFACLASLAALLSACGGGGGSDGGDPVLPSVATVTSSNYEGVARQSLVAATYLGDATGLVTGAQVAPGPQVLFAFARMQLGRLPGLLASRTRVVLSTAGPFALFGGPLVAACVRHGTHYVDITGETPWVKDMIDQHHEAAQRKGARIIPFCGFDSIPSDISVHLANAAMLVIAVRSNLAASWAHLPVIFGVVLVHNALALATGWFAATAARFPDDLDAAVPVPRDAPWFPRDVDAWSVRWVFLHVISELARHAGHADIIRESIDGATMYELIAAAEGMEPTPWLQPWRGGTTDA